MGLCCSDDYSSMNPTQVDLSHFIIHRVLGKGGFGKVSCVEHRTSGNLYAMKQIEKALLVSKDIHSDENVRATWLERELMSQFKSNFLVHLEYAFQDQFYLYMVMSFMRGGDLRFHLTEHRSILMNESNCRFYIAEIVLGLEEMHSLNIAYRDLKPENCLLDDQGHCRLSDFGLAVKLDTQENGKAIGQCGTNGFMAPEMLAGFEYDTSVDIYSLGVIMFELLHDHLPDLSEGTNHLKMRDDLSDEAQHLLMGLLEVIPEQRLGCTTAYRIEEIKMHPWFKSIDWESASRKELRPPFIPNSNIANCDPSYELEEQLLESAPPRRITASQDSQFIGFEYHVDLHNDDDASLNISDSSGDQGKFQIRRQSGSLVHLINGVSLKDPNTTTNVYGHGGDNNNNSDRENVYNLDSKVRRGVQESEIEMGLNDVELDVAEMNSAHFLQGHHTSED